ncbi:MAG TPA: transcription termination factor Rho [Streptosporangiaceae bacterium]|jgi:transcription termination factor Rho|nr:transcription termination factor Rho [Streptosporangiaceae bacterium]
MTTATPTRERNSRTPPASADSAPLQPVSGILDITSRAGSDRATSSQPAAFLHTAGFRTSPDDVSVPASLIRQYGLRRGDQLTGAARPGQNGKTRPKAPGLATVGTVNGVPADSAAARPHFDQLTPVYADERIRLEAGSASATARIIDLVGPIGLGQRGLIVSPPKAGKTLILKAIAGALSASRPDVHLMVVLVGERPEEVTDLSRSIDGEVIWSTFDDSAQDHTMVAELAIERAKRMVEDGRDVVVLLDSITRLARAYNVVAPSSSRILAGGVAASALQPPRRLLGAARNVEGGGSLTLLSTALIETGSRMDDVFFEEFKGTGNMELRLRRDLAEKRLYPAIDVTASGTRRDDLLMTPDEYDAVGQLRRGLAGLEPQAALELLLERTRQASSNAEFLRQIQLSGARA